jgi:hypothetical protein
MFFGKCRLFKERNTLLDKAKILYKNKLSKGLSTQPFISCPAVSRLGTDVMPEGWALKTSKRPADLMKTRNNT